MSSSTKVGRDRKLHAFMFSIATVGFILGGAMILALALTDPTVIDATVSQALFIAGGITLAVGAGAAFAATLLSGRIWEADHG